MAFSIWASPPETPYINCPGGYLAISADKCPPVVKPIPPDPRRRPGTQSPGHGGPGGGLLGGLLGGIL